MTSPESKWVRVSRTTTCPVCGKSDWCLVAAVRSAEYGLGFSRAVGRPSCTGGTVHVIALVRDLKPARVVLVRDNDEPCARGAEALARVLVLHARDVRVISPPPPHKDLRDWAAAGATRRDVDRVIDSAEVLRIRARISTKGAK